MDTTKLKQDADEKGSVKLTAPEKEKDHKGLCATCKNNEHCTFPRDKSRPVSQCEEFEGLERGPVETLEKFVSSISRSSGKEKPVNDYYGKYKGLCKTCEIKDSCVFQKPEGGVWHCEEYE